MASLPPVKYVFLVRDGFKVMYFAVGVPGDTNRRLDMCVFPFFSIDNLELLNRELLVLMMPQLRGKSSPELQFIIYFF